MTDVLVVRRSEHTRVTSVRRLFDGVARALAVSHRVKSLEVAPSDRQDVEALWRQFPVIVGAREINLVRWRPESSRGQYVELLLGELGRAAPFVRQMVPFLRRQDLLVGNCSADERLGAALFNGGTVRSIPLFAEQTFHDLANPNTVAELESLLNSSQRPVILYAGRFSFQKNVFSLLRAFRAVSYHVPQAQLVLVGASVERGVPEFDTDAADLSALLKRWHRELGFESGAVRILRTVSDETMRALYELASVVVSLSLQLDENFGYLLHEALASGTPIVASNWGGYDDAIGDGPGRIPAVVTKLGPKVQWWVAAERICEVLTDRDVAVTGAAFAKERAREFNPQRAAIAVMNGLEDARSSSEAVEPSDLAMALWGTSEPGSTLRFRDTRGLLSEPAQTLLAELVGPVPRLQGADMAMTVPYAPVALAAGFAEIRDPLFRARLALSAPTIVALRHLARTIEVGPASRSLVPLLPMIGLIGESAYCPKTHHGASTVLSASLARL